MGVKVYPQVIHSLGVFVVASFMFAIFCNPVMAMPADLLSDADLVHYYPLNGNSEDSVGTLDGTDNNISYSSEFSKFDQYAVFNGSNSSIITASSAGSTNFSVSAWLYLLDLTSSAIPLMKGDNYPNENWQWEIGGDGNFNIYANFSSSAKSVGAPNGTFTTGSWYNVVQVYDYSGSAKMYLYVNGESVGTPADLVASADTASRKFQLGTREGANFANMYLDDVAMFDKALSSAEVQLIYEENSGGLTPEVSSDVLFYSVVSSTMTSTVEYFAGDLLLDIINAIWQLVVFISLVIVFLILTWFVIWLFIV